MERYEKYKDSGVEWIGEIPGGWDVKRLKYACSITMGQSPNSKDCNQKHRGLPFLQGNAEFGYLNPKEKNWCPHPKKIAARNDVLLSVRAPIGDVNLADKIYGIGRGLCAISHENYKFLYYLCLILNQKLNSLGTGSTFKAVSTEQINNVLILLPSKPEQVAVANYLDQKTAQIDKLIVQKERLIELYEKEKAAIINQAVTKGINPDTNMKNSGVKWLGEIPEQWEIKKLKYFTYYFKGNAFKSSDFCQEGIPIVKASNIKNKTIQNVNSFISFDNQKNEFERVRLKTGDIIISTVGSKPEVKASAVGQLANVNEKFSDSYLNQNTVCIRPMHSVIADFLKYAFFSRYIRSKFDAASLWIANQAYLEVESIRNIDFPFPTPSEQKIIVKYIETETARINAKIEKTKKIIELQKEYRTALISEVMTGKIKVTQESTS